WVCESWFRHGQDRALACGRQATAPGGRVRLSEFWALVEQEFGAAYGRSIAGRHAIHALADRTAEEAIEAGVPVRRVWDSLCDDFDVPPGRRHLADPTERRPDAG